MSSTILPTQNEAWGFWGTMGERAAASWPLAFTAIGGATQQDAHAVRAFLDSRHGRHFADQVLSEMSHGLALQEAIDATTRSTWPGRLGAGPAGRAGSPLACPT